MGALSVLCSECKLEVDAVRLSCGTKPGLSAVSEESKGVIVKIAALSAHAPVREGNCIHKYQLQVINNDTKIKVRCQGCIQKMRLGGAN